MVEAGAIELHAALAPRSWVRCLRRPPASWMQASEDRRKRLKALSESAGEQGAELAGAAATTAALPLLGAGLLNPLAGDGGAGAGVGPFGFYR